MYDLDTSCPINWNDPLNRGLVSRWQVLPVSGWRGGVTLRDLVGLSGKKGIHGTLTNGPTWDGARGRPGGAGSILFDGSNDYVTCGNPSSLQLPIPFSLSLWVNYTTTSNTVVFENNSNFGWSVQVNSIGVAGVINCWSGGAGKGPYTTVALNTGTWRHVCAVIPSTGAGTIYVDGAAASALLGGGALNPSYGGTVYMGSRAGAAPWPGRLDDVRAWSRALSASEAKAIYEDSRSGSPRTLNWVRPGRFAFSLGGILYREQWCAGLDRHWVGGLT